MKKIKCNDCRHEWLPRTDIPIECPACKSRKWNQEKKLIQNGSK